PRRREQLDESVVEARLALDGCGDGKASPRSELVLVANDVSAERLEPRERAAAADRRRNRLARDGFRGGLHTNEPQPRRPHLLPEASSLLVGPLRERLVENLVLTGFRSLLRQRGRHPLSEDVGVASLEEPRNRPFALKP